MEFIIASIILVMALMMGRSLWDFRPVPVSYCLALDPVDEKIELSGGRMAFLGGLISGIGKGLGGVVGLAGKVASVIPGVGGVIGQAAQTLHGLVWPKQAAEMSGNTQVYGPSSQEYYASQAQAQPASNTIFGMSPTTLLLIGGGIFLIMYMRKKR